MNGIPRLRPRIAIVSPALAAANNGNWHTARRWQGFLAPVADVAITDTWRGEPADVLIALHARKSAPSIDAFRAVHPARPLALVLTGTDLYRDLDAASAGGANAAARRALQCADHLVVLQPEALRRLDATARSKARVIVQSAVATPARARGASGRGSVSCRAADFIAVGHLRDEKDPLTLMRAARRLAGETGAGAVAPSGGLPSRPFIVHLGDALDAALADAARCTMADCPGYRWLGGRSQPAARRWIARAGALVHMSRVEGGANVVIEAVCSRVPVLASRIDGNVGLLGDGYNGYFPPGDDAALAALMRRFRAEPAFAARLAMQCAAREALFAPEAESAAVRALLADLLGGAVSPGPAGAPLRQ